MIGRFMATILASALVVPSIILADGELRSESLGTALGEVKIDGLTIGSTTLNEFIIHCRNRQQARNPKFRRSSRRIDGDAKHGVESFAVTGVPNCDELQCDFINERLSRMRVVYFAERVNVMGGVDAIVRTVTHRFGLSPPTIDEATMFDGTKAILISWPSTPPSRVAKVGEVLTASKLRHCGISLYVTARLARLDIVDARAESVLGDRRGTNANLGF